MLRDPGEGAGDNGERNETDCVILDIAVDKVNDETLNRDLQA